MDPRRADLAPAGALLLDAILDGLGADEITLCDFALREGLVLDYIKRNAQRIRTIDRYPDVRRRSVVELGERCNYLAPHAQQVARLALAVFDGLKTRHRLGQRNANGSSTARCSTTSAPTSATSATTSTPTTSSSTADCADSSRTRSRSSASSRATIVRRRPKASHDGYKIAVETPAARGPGARRDRAACRGTGPKPRAGRGRRPGDRERRQTDARAGDAPATPSSSSGPPSATSPHSPKSSGARYAVRSPAVAGPRPTRTPRRMLDTLATPHTLSRPPVRGRGHRRIGQDDAAQPAVEVADGQRPPGVRHRMELVGARQGGDQGRQEEERADADDVQPAARDRLRGPAAVQDHPAAQGRHDRARRPLRLHGVRARRRARRGPPVGARPLQLRRAPESGGLLPRADRGLAGPAARPPRQAQVLRGRHGHGLEREHHGELPNLPVQGARGVRPHRARARARGRRRTAQHHRAAAAVPRRLVTAAPGDNPT